MVLRTENQRLLWNSLEKNPITFVVGFPGSGKTAITLHYAAQSLLSGLMSRLYIFRPMPSTLGYLPGNEVEKVLPYQAHIYEAIVRSVGEAQMAEWVREERIITKSLETSRGMNFYPGDFVIVDECQNLTDKDFFMILTRLNNETKLVFCGDAKQIDIAESGLQEVLEKVKNIEGIGQIHMKSLDCQRSHMVKHIAKAWGY